MVGEVDIPQTSFLSEFEIASIKQYHLLVKLIARSGMSEYGTIYNPFVNNLLNGSLSQTTPIGPIGILERAFL